MSTMQLAKSQIRSDIQTPQEQIVEINNIYNSLNRLTNITHSKGANNIATYTQAYDSGSRIVGIGNQDGTANYNYDSTNQLTGADYNYQSDEGYTYDSNGNRTNSGYVTGVNNQLLEDAKYRYRYDAVGNRVKRVDKVTGEVTQYVWDIRDRLIAVNVFNANGDKIRAASYVYDVYDQRIAKTVDADGDGVLAPVTERFVYGADQNIALAFDGDGILTHRYLFGDGVDLIEADQQVVTGATLWALADHEGSVRDVVDSSGAVLNHVVYDAFGNVSSQSNSSVVFRFGYTARELDSESGLQYNRARYFDPAVGRFISEDRIGFAGGDTNLYRYVFNSPTNASDPSGDFAIQFATYGFIAILATVIVIDNYLKNQNRFIDQPQSPNSIPPFPDDTPPQTNSKPLTYPNNRGFNPNDINRGRDFGNICSLPEVFPSHEILFPQYLQARKDKIYLGDKYNSNKDDYHPQGGEGSAADDAARKDDILKDAKASKYSRLIGNNPNIEIINGEIILVGQGKYKGKSKSTGLRADDYFNREE